MAGSIKGITLEIGGDTQPLQKAFADVNKNSKNLQSELKQVERLLKLDPKNTELLAQKQKILADAVSNSKEKLDKLKKAQEDVNKQFQAGKINEEQYRAFQREVAKAEQELKGFEKQLKNTAASTKILEQKMTDAGNKMKDVGGTMTKYVTVPIAAAGAGMVAAGKQFDDAYDKIRIGTGATGKALEGLNGDFRAVAKQVSSSFDDISTAIAEYNTRLGISGQALEDLSVQTLNLARITESPLTTVIEEVSQSLQAFNTPVQKYGESLDFIFKVSQSTGIAIDRLLSNLVKFAPALKGMGFDFEESATLMGYFDKAGVEVEQAMAGLNKALVNMAKKGVTDSSDALRELLMEIRKAPNALRATEMAIEIFGAKAGPLMASAIRDGKLEYDELIATLLSSKETINGVADDTDDWAEGLAKLKNNVLIATEPIATTLFDALNGLVPLLEKAVPALTGLAQGFAAMPQGLQLAIVAIAGLAAAIGPLLQGIGTIVIAMPGLVKVFAFLSKGVGPIISVLGTVARVVIPAIGTAISTVVPIVVNAVRALIMAIGGFSAPVTAIVMAIAAAAYLIIKNWDQVKEFFSNLWENVKNIFSSAWEAITNFLSGALQGIINLFIQYHPIGIIISHWDEIKAYLLGIASQAIEWGSNIVQGLVNGIRERIGAAVEAARELGSSVAEAVKNFFSIRSPSKVMEDFGRYIAEGLADGIGKGAAAVSEATSKMMSAVTGAVDKVVGSIDLSVGIMEKKFKLIELTVGKSMNSLEKYGLKKSLLGEQISAIADQATVLEAAYAKIANTAGPESDDALKMYGRLLDAKIKYAEMSNELGKITQNEARMRKNMALIESGAALASGATAAGVVGGGTAKKEVNIEVNNYGTKGESSEGATTRELQKLQILGVFG